MTLRLRLTLWFAGTLAAAMALYGAFVYFIVEAGLRDGLEREVHDEYERAEALLGIADAAGGAHWLPDFSPQWARLDLAPPWAHAGDRLPTVHVIGADGRTIHRSLDFVEDGSLRILEWPHAVKPSSPGARTETVVIRAGRPVEPVQRELRRLLLVLGLGLPLGVGAAALGGWFLAGRALAPVGAMADRARAITADRLSERLPVGNTRDEVGRLAVVFNETLARLEQSFDRLRRFTADASHELRTPLTAIRTVGEVGLREPRDPAAYREVIGSMLEEVDRLSRLVDSLLLLSRADAGQVPLEVERLEASALLRSVAEPLSVLAEEKGVRIALDGTGPLDLDGDRSLLRRLLVNLLDNAIRESPAGATVRLAARAAGPDAVFEVADEGPGIPAEHRERIFDRFFRVDESRAREAGGAGLGLAIARWAVEAHGGRIEVDSSVGKGSTFRVVLPRDHGGKGGRP